MFQLIPIIFVTHYVLFNSSFFHSIDLRRISVIPNTIISFFICFHAFLSIDINYLSFLYISISCPSFYFSLPLSHTDTHVRIQHRIPTVTNRNTAVVNDHLMILRVCFFLMHKCLTHTILVQKYKLLNKLSFPILNFHLCYLSMKTS